MLQWANILITTVIASSCSHEIQVAIHTISYNLKNNMATAVIINN